MRISDRLRHIDAGIIEASVVMATETNKDILIQLGFPPSKILEAQESDVIIAIRTSDNKSLELGLAEVDKLLELTENISISDNATAKIDEDVKRTNDIDSALKTMPDVNLALLSIPGEHIKKISLRLIDLGIHQHIFSDHVPIEDEVEIKRNASRKGVLILGPEAGTSIINGKGIGFSNAVAPGPVGIVAAAGTGLQEVTSLLDHCGIGVKHGLGVGGNDTKAKIGGIMMLECMKVIEQDKDIDVIAIISKPPSPAVMKKIIHYAANKGNKKYVLAFIGGGGDSIGDVSNKKDMLNATIAAKSSSAQKNVGAPYVSSNVIVKVNSLASSVLAIADVIGPEQLSTALSKCYLPPEGLFSLVRDEWTKLQSHQKYIRALYTGGTFAYEAQVILGDMIRNGSSIYSNSPIDKIKQLEDSFKSNSHAIIDLGEEEFTKGRPHPMIDPTIRKHRIREEANDQEVAVILLDFVLGFGSNSDPVEAVLDELKEAKTRAEESGRYLSVVAHVCGTKHDLQGYEQSVSNLKNAGCIVLPTNTLAAVASAFIVSRGKIDLAHIYEKYLDLPCSWEES
jgi:succinyl-CoA synthetase alpha subunit